VKWLSLPAMKATEAAQESAGGGGLCFCMQRRVAVSWQCEREGLVKDDEIPRIGFRHHFL
jgi:hypothetical protein